MTNLRLFTLTGLRHITRHKLRTLLTLLGVIVGVATFIFGPALAASIDGGVRRAIDDIAGNAELEVRAGNEGFSADILPIIRAAEGVELAVPMATTGGIIVGQPEMVVIFGVDPLLDPQIRSYALASGVFPSAEGQAMLTQAYAAEKNITLGDQVTVLTPGGLRTLSVVGTLVSEGVALLNGGDLVIMGLADAQGLRGGKLDTVSLVLSADAQTVIANLQPLLPEGVQVAVAQARAGTYGEISMFLNMIMLVIPLMIVVMSSTLIYNTMAVAVAQRRTEIGVLRALGVTRRDLQQGFIIEAGVIGAIGSVLGIGLGFLIVNAAATLPVLPMGTFAPGVMMSKVEITIPPLIPPLALASSVLICMLAGYFPSRAASRIDPVEALTVQKAEVRQLRVNYRRVIIAVIVVVSAVLITLTLDTTEISPIPIVLIYGILGAALLALPSYLAAFGGWLPNLMAHFFGLPGYLAADNITRRPGRMTATASILLIGAWAAYVASNSNFGYNGMTSEWNQGENVFDLMMVGAGTTVFEPNIALPATLPHEVQARPAVESTMGERITRIEYNGGSLLVRAVDTAVFAQHNGQFLVKDGDKITSSARLAQTDRPAVLVTAYLLTNNRLNIGDMLTLPTPEGMLELEIIGTVYGAMGAGSPAENGIILDRGLYTQYWNDPQIDRLSIMLHPDADAQAERRELLSAYALQGALVYNPSEIAEAIVGRIQSTVVVSQMLSTMLLVTILLGVANTLFIVILDRRRELGMLRALGLRTRQITLSLVLEAALLVLLVAVLAIPIALFNGYINNQMLANFIGFPFAANAREIVFSMLLILVSAMMAAYIPARQAGRVDVLSSLRYE